MGKNYKSIDKDVIEKCFRELMEKGLGLDMSDPNFIETPQRVARSYEEIFAGLDRADDEIHKIFETSFPTD